MAITNEQDKARPTGTLGVERWVQFAYAACAITLAWFLIKGSNAIWTILADSVDAIPEPNGTMIAVGAGLVAFISAVIAYRSDEDSHLRRRSLRRAFQSDLAYPQGNLVPDGRRPHRVRDRGDHSRRVRRGLVPHHRPHLQRVSPMKWYVVQAYSGYENKVKLSLEERIKQAGMEGRFGNILIPKENVQESRGGKRRLSSRTFYPGYIFVQMDLDDQTWHLIKDTPKVNGFVGGRHPSPVPEREIAAIEQQVEEGAAKPKPRVEFEKGDHVRVTDGAFANFTGAIEEVNHEKHKVRVLVSIFGRATPRRARLRPGRKDELISLAVHP